MTGNQRGKRNVRVNTSLVQVEGVATKEEAQFYLGKVRLSCWCRWWGYQAANWTGKPGSCEEPLRAGREAVSSGAAG